MKVFYLKYIIPLVLLMISISVYSQSEIDPNGYNKFYHENGELSSEGYMRNGKPDGYWKTYNEEGILITEGNRKNFELDSLWKFYNAEGELIMEVNYEGGKKNGLRRIYRENEIIEENFENEVKQGITRYYYPDGSLKKTLPFVNGLEQGQAFEYGRDGRIIGMITYEKGFIKERETINRFDQQNKKHGKWKYFHENGVVRMEGKFRHGVRNGYFKEYDKEGNLINTSKYVNGEKQEDVAELKKLDIKKDYYPDGKVKVVASYKDGVPEGVRREYNEEGEIEKAIVYKNGIVIGEGVMTPKGEREGLWKEYYDSGKLKAEGNYSKDKRTGDWQFYHENGNLEQTGAYDSLGRYAGQWKWYYETGSLLRTESFYEGLADGLMTEYDINGNIVAEGEYIEGLENGFWFFDYGDIKMEGDYIDGLRNGLWKHHYSSGQLSFQGKFIDDNPNGKHVFYWPNGNKKDEGYYVMGRKDGDWKRYDADGNLVFVITYEQGRETRYDGIKVNLENVN